MKPEWRVWKKKWGMALAMLAVTFGGLTACAPQQEEETEPVYYFMEKDVPMEVYELGECEAVQTAKITGEARLAIEAEARKKPAYVTSYGTLNVRAAASTDAEIVGQFTFKQEITLTDDQEGDFYPVIGTDCDTGEEIVGYCYASYISEEAPPASHVYLMVPSFKQFDPQWKDIKLGGYETMHTAGCTTTCLAMVESYLISYRTPATQAANTWYNYDGCLSFSSAYTAYNGDDALAVVYQKLHEGRPVLYSRINPSGTAHWVVIYGYLGDGENFNWSDFLINDPGSDTRYNVAAFAADYPYFNKIVYPNY